MGWLQQYFDGMAMRGEKLPENLRPGGIWAQPSESGLEFLAGLGRAAQADGVLFGFIFRYEDRQGDAFAVARPASVAFDLHLMDARNGEIIWKDAWDETQKALSDDLFAVDLFIQRRGKWISADEMAMAGLEAMLMQIWAHDLE